MEASEKNKNKKPFYRRWWFISVVVVVLLAMLLSSSEEDPLTPDEIQVFKESVQKYEHKDIERNPDSFKNKPAVFNGKVVQVSEGSFNTTTLRVATKGDYDDIIFVTHKRQESETRILEGDKVTVYGVLDGVTSYTSVLGHKITLPSVKAKIIEIE